MGDSQNDTDDAGVFQQPNEGKIIENPRWVCEECGYANVEMFVANGMPAAKCTNCGVGYLELEADR